VLVVQRIAESQDGLITAAQCRAAGVTVDQVKRLLRQRRWRTVTRGVYLVNSDLLAGEPSPRMSIRAAVLSAGPHAVAVLSSAAVVHGLQGLRRDDQVHVSLPGRLAVPKRVNEATMVPHQLILGADQPTVVDGIAVTRRSVPSLM
jgi:hypothetical protein